ncbi:rod shape-determining protein RodA [Alkalinema sp. FACHB-956]|uniref:rod shape-determining protein RodA n=1 Tax=Alkalinema sp. FACHB-956 TaxID=2692768 RepID=UPI0016894E48|nr:rod shape-determining protein RodA [Alkalinema sp. FACHB-956]MBD2325325.1 rod shape-determining protein RodA [Alkalinema sp. FACHB-956]
MFQKSLFKIRWRSWIQPWEGMDWWLFAGTVGLMVLGGIMIYSVEHKQAITDWSRHWITGGVGIFLALLIARTRYEVLLQWRWLVYGITVLGLLAVMFFGTEGLGAQRWIPIGPFYLQPSEFAKLGVIITIASLLHEQPASTLPAMLRVLGVVAVPWLLIFLEPNLGTSLVFGSITLGMLYWGNANPGWLILMLSPAFSAIILGSAPNVLKNIQPALEPFGIGIWLIWVFVMGVIAFRSLPWKRWGTLTAIVANLISGGLFRFLWENVLRDYQKDRLTAFMHPEADPLGSGYHLIQSRIAIGAGELWGRGLYKGTQTQLNFIPEQHTDFIFTAIGEELGFIGCIAVLATFLLICYRLLIIAQNAKDDFGSLIAVGIFSMWVFQTFVNIGMTINLSPVTGIPLPFLSYGNAALLMNFLAVGVVSSVANHRQRTRF